MATELSKKSRNVFYAPLRLGLCNNNVCGQYTSIGSPIWHDNGHITEKVSGELAGYLSSKLRTNGFYDFLELAPARSGAVQE